MKHLPSCALFLSLLLAPAAAQSAVPAPLELLHARPAAIQVSAVPGAATRVEVDLGASRLTLELEPRSLRTAGFQVLTVDDGGRVVELPAPFPHTYRGEVAGIAGSRVAASLLDDGLHARVLMPAGEELWIEPAGAGHVVYSGEDVVHHHGVCGTDDAASFEEPREPAGAGAGGAGEATAALSVAELAIDADFQYYQQRGGNYNNVVDRIETVINTMNVQYETQVEITHLLTAIVVRTSPIQPYSTTNPGGLLNQFGTEWSTSFSGIVRDVAQLFTGRNLAGSVIGISQLGSVCTGGAYSLVESDFNGLLRCATDLSAHELGHSWGAGHCNCPSNTMNASITCANDFANVSINAITNFRNSRPCLAGSTCSGPFVVNRSAAGNPQAYTASPVVVGQPTTFTVDTNGFQTARIFGVAAPTFRPLDGGTALINPESGSFFAIGPLPGPIAQTSLVVTNDPSLCGVTIYSQALLRNAGGALLVTNAQDLRIGL